ncbi:MAG: PKD-like domain-containing protein, partial [Saprospiraceae bacterium]|nr:PKD-like domain-containing protein [Saprospiraceae bacterium]
AVNQEVTITVNPVPEVDPVDNQTHCAGDQVPATVFTSSVPGAVFSWSRAVPTPDIGSIPASGIGDVPGFIATNNSDAPITVTFEVVASFTANGVTCTGSPVQFTITVLPDPTVNPVADQTYCAGEQVPSTVFTSSVGGAVFNWTRTVSMPDIGLVPIAGTGDVPGFTSTNSSNAPITAIFTVVASVTANGVTCEGDPIQFSITINPVPQVNPVPNQTHCAGDQVPATVFTSSVPGAVFSWSRAVPTPDIGSVPASGMGDVPGFLATNASDAPITVTFEVVASFTNNGVTCTGDPVQFTITVLPNPPVDPVADQTFCAGEQVPATVFTSSVGGAVFSWTRTVPVPDIGLVPIAGTGDVPDFTATNTSNAPINSIFTVVATVTANGVTCTGDPIQFNITINPAPQIDPVVDQTHCAGDQVPATVFSSSVPGTVFSWTRTVPVPDIGLVPTDGIGDVPGFTATNSSNAPITSVFEVVATFTANGETCSEIPIQFSITINPVPQIDPVDNQTYCAGEQVPATVFTSNVPGAVFDWSRTVPVPDIGLVPDSGIGDVPAYVATNASNAPIVSTFTVDASFSNGGIDCPGNPIQYTVTINPSPNAVATPAAQTICSGNAITTIVLSGNVSGTLYNWTRDNTIPVTGIADSGSGNISGTLTNTTNAPITVTFTITPELPGCTGTPITATVLVNPAPAVFAVTGGGMLCMTDNIGLPVDLSGSQTNVNYQLRLNGNPVGAPVAGTGAAISFGPQITPGTYTVLAVHTQGGCTSDMGGSAEVTIFNCRIEISNPCVCLNNATTLENGQFDETIKLEAPNSQSWTVIAVNGFYTQGGPAPPAAPIPMAVGTILMNNGGNIFTLDGRHIDALGYTLTVSNGQGTIFNIGNACQYPNPVITANLSGPFCLYSDPVPLTGDPGDANIVSEGFTVNGLPATQFDPSQGAGQYVIVYTVNGGMPKAFGLTDPGCIQAVSLTVNVVGTPQNLACNNLVIIGLDADCVLEITADLILEGNYLCFDDYLVELDCTLPLGNGPWVPAIVNASNIGNTCSVRVTHLVSGNSCIGNIKIEDNLDPSINCEDFSVPCNTADLSPAYLQNVLNIDIAYPSIMDCQGFSLSHVDTETPQNCASGLTKIISRQWTVVDGSGNSATCIQIISLIRPAVIDITLPPNYDGLAAPGFDCSNAYPTPEWIESQGLQGFPYFMGTPVACSINGAHKDVVIEICDGTYSIAREWTIIDFCAGTVLHHQQLIAVTDEQPPLMTCPPNMTVSVDPYTCCGTIDLPDLIVEDICSQINNVSGIVTTFDPFTQMVTGIYPFIGTLQDFPGNNLWYSDTLAVFGFTACLPIGAHTVKYEAEDDCGNVSSCTFEMKVEDLVPPVAICDQFTVVSLAAGGQSLVYATTFDDGSYDNCCLLGFEVARMSADDCGDTNFGETVTFCCSDVGDTLMVVFRVTDCNGNVNDCMVLVQVQDKIKPSCTAPAQIAVDCEHFDPSLWAYGIAQVTDNCCLDTSKVFMGQLGLTHQANYSLFDTVCKKGTIN